MRTLLFLLLLAITFTSCKKELEPQQITASPIVMPPADAASATAQTSNSPIQQQPPGATAVSAQPTAKTAPGMNPPHGQPGHRCDIAVGAPLNSAAGKTAQPASTGTPVKMTPAVVNSDGTITPGSGTTITTTNNNNPSTPALLQSPSNAATAAGMNPPHGQAGHRCDVAVGAPLPK